MEETISTTVETPQEQTTPDVAENQTIGNEIAEQVRNDDQPDATQESENVADETTENVD